jgi:hypothetical protein
MLGIDLVLPDVSVSGAIKTESPYQDFTHGRGTTSRSAFFLRQKNAPSSRPASTAAAVELKAHGSHASG